MHPSCFLFLIICLLLKKPPYVEYHGFLLSIFYLLHLWSGTCSAIFLMSKEKNES
jgi:hypothetical protein